MYKNRKLIHTVSFILGFYLFTYAIFSAIFFNNPRFYTLFALGAYFILDFIDYKLNKTSVMAFFLNRHHWYAFPIFILISTIACFVVDFILGVNIAKMWRWKNYNSFDFLMMFLFMNASYILGMYEIFRIVRSFFEGKITDKHLVKFRLSKRLEVFTAVSGIVIGIVGFVFPFWAVFSKSNFPIEFIMLMPFMGLMVIPDSITYLLHGKPIISEIIRVNLLLVLSLFFTIVIASLGTEILNLFGGEWEYLKMPFSHLTVLSVPLAVFIGWVPLVISTICIVTLVKHLTYLYDLRKR
jgi:hypothetical protein